MLNFFTGVHQNLGKSKVVSSDAHSNPKVYELLTLAAEVNVKILAMAWNTTHLPREDRYCDLEGCVNSCEVGCILICRHAYHFECFLFKLGSQCQYCTDYLVSGIQENCKNYQKSLTSPPSDNLRKK